jgi:hypothetical protein
MHKKAIPYRDTHAAPGSQLHEALASGDTKKARTIYEQCESDARDLSKRSQRFNQPKGATQYEAV